MQFFSYLFVPLKTFTLSISKAPCASTHIQSATPCIPQFALLPQGQVLQPLFSTSHYISNISFFLSISFFCLRHCQNTGASEELALQLSTFQRHHGCLLPCLFTGEFYSFGSKEKALELIKGAFVSACCAMWMYYSWLEGKWCGLLYKGGTKSAFGCFKTSSILYGLWL